MIKKITKIILLMILVIIFIYTAIITVQKVIWKEKTPSIFGYKSFIVLSGSMEPTINIGDIVFIKETENIDEQDIISFDVNNSVVTHRVIEILVDENNNKQYKTKGDANSSEDTELISADRIEGRYCFKIGKVGNILLFFRSKIGIVILLIIFLLLLVNVKPKRPSKKVNSKH